MQHDVEPFVVRAVAPNKPKDKTELEFKKGQEITVEKINKDAGMYFGFYGKKEGWFSDYFVQRADGIPPEIRKNKAKAPPAKKEPSKKESAPKKEPTPAQPTLANGVTAATTGSEDKKKLSKKQAVEQKKQEKAAQVEATKKKKEDARLASKKKGTKSKDKKGNSKGKSKPTAAQANANTAVIDEKALLPSIVETTVAYLEQPERLKLEGLFRVSGSLNDVKSIKADFLKGKKVDLSKVQDPHTVAGVLKIFFRESKDPLLTYELYDCWVAAIATPGQADKINSVRQVIDLLPSANRRILVRLMGLLAKVAQYQHVNLMTVNNIAIVFAPTLLRPPGDQIDIAIQDSSYANHLIKFMIEEYEALFVEKKPETPDKKRRSPTQTPASSANVQGVGQLPNETDEQFEKRIRRGSLLLARGSMIGGHNSWKELPTVDEEEEESGVAIDLSSEDLEGSTAESESDGNASESESTDESEQEGGVMSMEEMMDKILEGHVNEVDDYLATLSPEVAAATKKSLLERIDALMQSEDFKD